MTGVAEATMLARPLARRDRLRRTRYLAWLITGGYSVFAILWIYFSDQLLGLLVVDPALLVELSVYKGIGFVFVTAMLLLLLLLRAFGAVDASYDAIEDYEAHIERFNHIYGAVSQINQAIARTPGRQELFSLVCEALVTHGRFRLAAIACQDELDSAGTLQVAASFGVASEIAGKFPAAADAVTGQPGPVRIALRSGQPAISNRMQDDPTLRSCRDDAIRNDWRACAAFPIREGESVRGVLLVTADATGFFDAATTALLIEVALDVSLALGNLSIAQRRREAEARATKEQAFSSTMIESMPGVLYFYDEQGSFLRWNRNMEQISGYTGDEIVRMHPLQFIAPTDQARVGERMAKVFDEGQSSIEAPLLAKDGTRTPYLFTGRRVEFDGRTCLVGVGMDISDRTEAQAALLELNETLEHRVAQRTSELEATAIRAEAADRLKSAFLATMSHELRTPLNSIIGFTGILLQELAGPLNPEQSKQLGMVRGSARHLLDLINDVLDLSKIEAGQLDIRAEPLELQAAIAQVVAQAAPLAERKSLSVDTRIQAGLGTVIGDPRRFSQILINLLNNAVKFTDRGGVTLVVDTVSANDQPTSDQPAAASSTDTLLRVRVSDTGIGIRQQDIDSLFKPFVQLDSGLSRQHEGTGLGLAICARLAGLMGGSMSARSQLGEGSEFTVLLPLHRVSAQ